MEKLNLVLQDRSELVVGARTDATEESEILRRAEMPAATDADVLRVDGVRSVEWIRKVRGMVGSKPLLFNQIAGGLSPRLSLTGLEELGINVAIYSTPCLFAAHTAMANAVTELRTNDGRLAEVTTDDVGVASSIALLERNLSRHHPRPDSTGPRKCALPADVSTPDNACILLLLTTVAVASLLPARGIVAVECAHATTLAIGLLFFLSGARLSTRAAIAGLRHWRLHGRCWPSPSWFSRSWG